MAKPLPINPLPRPPGPWIREDGAPTEQFRRFMSLAHDQLVIGPLVEAAHDVAAKAAGVPLYGLYQTSDPPGPTASTFVKIRIQP